jgi:hypothetical protein
MNLLLISGDSKRNNQPEQQLDPEVLVRVGKVVGSYPV